jgi:phage repressor protein C with HTH and peptisase S24 domain
VTLVLQATGVSLADFAALADDAPSSPQTVPLLGLASAGLDGFFDDAGLPAGDGWDQTELPRASASTFSLRITGDSMSPLYREGDRVIVDRSGPAVRRGDRIVARLTSGEVVAKELTGLTARAATLASINPAYPLRMVARGDIEWMARILWVSQ